MARAMTQQMVVLVNNEDWLRNHVATTLRGAGWAVRAYKGAVAALDDIDRLPVDALVLDWTNSPLDKLELWRRVRDTHPVLSVVYLSPHADDIAVLLAGELHPPLATIMTPVSPRQLVAAFTRCLGGAG